MQLDLVLLEQGFEGVEADFIELFAMGGVLFAPDVEPDAAGGPHLGQHLGEFHVAKHGGREQVFDLKRSGGGACGYGGGGACGEGGEEVTAIHGGVFQTRWVEPMEEGTALGNGIHCGNDAANLCFFVMKVVWEGAESGWERSR
jgi:hypothetical protein